jgi:DNA processing protein
VPMQPEITAALAALPGAGSVRLGRLLTDHSAEEAWSRVRTGGVAVDVAPAAIRSAWRVVANDTDLVSMADRLSAVGVAATNWHDAEHPSQFTADIDPAPVAFRDGALANPAMPHVAIVGTRRASAIGREIARELGGGLAANGVVVVSGLALGVDGAAHGGALSVDGAPPVAVVGSGLDSVYPAAHRDLWASVAAAGVVLSESPMGARPEAWRFPARNRLIVAMSDLVVVVESRAAGGSLLTVDEAVRRGVDVMAVPGSLRNGAAVGTNQLLADGCAPVRDVDDVLVALGLDTSGAAARRAETEPSRSAVSPEAQTILDAIDDGPTSCEQLVVRLEIGAAQVFAGLAELELAGLIAPDGARVRRR